MFACSYKKMTDYTMYTIRCILALFNSMTLEYKSKALQKIYFPKYMEISLCMSDVSCLN